MEKLYIRLLKFKKEERYTYRALAELTGETFVFITDFCRGRVTRCFPETAIKIDHFLSERGY